MTKLLEQAIAKIRESPTKDQDALANALLSIPGEERAAVHLDDDTRAAIEEGLAKAERGEFVSDEIVAEADKRHGIRGFAVRRGHSLTAKRFSTKTHGGLRTGIGRGEVGQWRIETTH